jgi:hypothetical protein
MEKHIADFEKGEDIVRVTLSEFKGRQYVNVRIYYMNDEGEWKPTRKGITLSPEMMRDVHGAVGEALQALEDSGVEVG